MRTRSRLATAATTTVVGVTLAALAGCATGDGTTLREPAGGALEVADVPIGTPEPVAGDQGETADAAVGGETLASVTLGPDPVVLPDPDAPTLPAPAPSESFQLTAPWPDGGEIDARYGCDGSNAAPPLAWNGVPDGTAELAVVLVDESDLSRGRPFVHWVMTGIDPTLAGLVENELPVGAPVALNFFGNVAYDGPCPPPDSTHVYSLTVFALAQQLELAGGTPAADVIDTIRAVTFAESTVTGSRTR